MKWEKSEINKAITELQSGKTFEEISLLFNRTSKAVKVKLNKLGYKYNDYSKINTHKNVVCNNCNKTFDCLISDNRKFCSNSCAATINNSLYKKRTIINEVGLQKCLNCYKEIKHVYRVQKFCNKKCEINYNKKIIFEKIESGDTTLSNIQYKKYLIQKYGNHCMECGWAKTNPLTGKVPIELEHIDGNSDNNCLNNLKLLCPNCHSLTPTYKALNIGNGRHKRRERYKDGKSY